MNTVNARLTEDSEFFGMNIRGSWTKYGGARQAIVKSKRDDTWFCQSCAKEQPQGLPGFIVPFGIEHVRICSICYSKARTINFNFQKLIKLVRASLT